MIILHFSFIYDCAFKDVFNCHIKKEFIYNTKIQNKKKPPTTHSSNKVVEDSIKCLKMHFLSFYFQYLKCAFERPLLICIHWNHIIVLNKNSYSKFKSNWISQDSNLKVDKVTESASFSFSIFTQCWLFWCLSFKTKTAQYLSTMYI